MLAAVSENSAILLDRNVVTEIVSRFDSGETKGRPADFIDMLAGMDVSINPGLYAMEGSLRRIPDSAHVREELAWADLKSVVEGKSGSVGVDLGGRSINKKK